MTQLFMRNAMLTMELFISEGRRRKFVFNSEEIGGNFPPCPSRSSSFLTADAAISSCSTSKFAVFFREKAVLPSDTIVC